MLNFELIPFIQALGHAGIITVIFVESGLLIGFFLPGDSLLFTAGMLAAQGYLSLPILLVGTFLAAVLGDNVGYWFGKKVGPAIFNKPDSLLFSHQRIEDAHHFFIKHGSKALILARFTPGVRTLTPILAGVGRMPYRQFMHYNIMGGALWAIGMTTFGYLLGNIIPNPDKYLLPITIIVIIISLASVAREWYKTRSRSNSDHI